MKFRCSLALCVLMMLSLTTLVLADPVLLTHGKYELKESQYIPGETVSYLVEGIPIGHFIPHSTVATTTSSSDENASSEVLRRESLSPEKNKVVHEPAVSPGLHSTSENLAKFVECSRRSLPILKDLIRYEDQIAETVKTAQPLSSNNLIMNAELARKKLESERWNSLSDGLVCGIHLKKDGFKTKSSLDDAKILSAVVKRSSDAKSILRVYAVANRYEEVSPAVRGLWQIYSKILGIRAQFSSSALPSIQELKKEVVPSMTVRLSQAIKMRVENDLDHLTREGLKFYEQISFE